MDTLKPGSKVSTHYNAELVHVEKSLSLFDILSGICAPLKNTPRPNGRGASRLLICEKFMPLEQPYDRQDGRKT